MRTASSQGIGLMLREVRNSRVPVVNALDPTQVNTVCKRGSPPHSGRMSRSRVAAVTLWTIASTVRDDGTVRQVLPCSPASSSTHGSARTPPF
ncbi:hypothetical protein ACFQ16_30450 [Saccharopolyspora rosea]|uniref:Uncharacterized protein n=1 Tax=Saccharopolyspora rosea TaxID=524884 RepID=A0ABW3G1E2_9PSEU